MSILKTTELYTLNGVDFMVCELHLNFMVHELKNQTKNKKQKNPQNPNGQVMRILPGLFAKGPRNLIVRINQCIHFENGITVCGCGSRNPSLLSLCIRTEAY